MERISDDLLTRLQTPDERALVFNSFGFGGRLQPEAAARFQASTVASARLAEGVPEGIRSYWERVLLLHRHGVLEYEFFSAAADLSLLALEGALRRRFVDFYSGRVPVVGRRRNTRGAEAVLLVQRFEQLWDAAREWDLRAPGQPQRSLPTSLAPLLAWARNVRLLPGRRSRRIDQSLVKLRNWAAHPEDYTLDAPPSVARGLNQIAEYINMLWGVPSPHGRTFKTHVHRRPRVVGISPSADAGVELRHDQVAALAPRHRGYGFSVLLAADEEELLPHLLLGRDLGREAFLAPGFQHTQFPCERLFDGDWAALNAAVDAGAFDERQDDVNWLDRLFLIRDSVDGVDLARSPDDVLAMSEPIEGRWWAITADGPWDAFAHARDHGSFELDENGTCPECFVGVAPPIHNWAELIDVCTTRQRAASHHGLASS